MAKDVFDRSFLPPARCELVVLSDTHYLLHPELQGGEWESIRQFPERAERALRLAGALVAGAPGSVVVHLGDVTHEYPETGEAVRSRAAAQAQFNQLGLRPYVAPGNMDIGDKPDPTSPAEWVTPVTLAAWDAAFGRSWTSFDIPAGEDGAQDDPAHADERGGHGGTDGGIHGVVLNSAIMNGPLSEAEAQRRWLEADLEAHAGRRIFLFMHHPPFFVDPDERAYGMYNSLDEPARGWLLALIRRYRVELVFAGHTHFVALNRVGETRCFVAPSTTTSRAGLPEAFTVCPPDRGRSDLAKLGFYLVRVGDRPPATGVAGWRAPGSAGADVHLIRTGTNTPALDPADPRRRLLTATSRGLPASPVGVVATHPLGQMTPGPIIWPSVVRQRVRDDWRLMACLELGARHVRVPESDLDEPSERARLEVLRDEGVAITAFWLWSERLDLPARLAAHRPPIDGLELLVPGTPLPPPACLRQVAQLRAEGLPVTLSTAIRTAPAPGQYHRRTRIGYDAGELAELDEWLRRHECYVDRVVCRVPAADPATPPWDTMLQMRRLLPLRQIGAVDLALDFLGEDTAAHAALAAEIIFAAAALPGAGVWLGPLVDLDRSMDTGYGLLDRLSNPRPAFYAASALNTILFAPLPAPARATPAAAPPYEPLPDHPSAAGRMLALAGGGRRLWLFPEGVSRAVPAVSASREDRLDLVGVRSAGRIACYHLVETTSETIEPAPDGTASAAVWAALARVLGPVLLVASASIAAS